MEQHDAAYEQTFVVFGGNFRDAGKASTEIKSILRELGISPLVIRQVAIAAYEAEMNIVMYAGKGRMAVRVTPSSIEILAEDEGPGIADIEKAMEEGFSTATQEMREMGFGAGMGLPNIKRNTDDLKITSTVGKGTRLQMIIHMN